MKTIPVGGKEWRLAGSSACLLKRPDLAMHVWPHLDAAGRAFLKYVCPDHENGRRETTESADTNEAHEREVDEMLARVKEAESHSPSDPPDLPRFRWYPAERPSAETPSPRQRHKEHPEARRIRLPPGTDPRCVEAMWALDDGMQHEEFVTRYPRLDVGRCREIVPFQHPLRDMSHEPGDGW